MPREHVEFVQQQLLDWEPVGAFEPLGRTAWKSLSVDRASGARSCVLRYPDGFACEEMHWLTCDEEFLVLDGTLRINGSEYGTGDYAYLPAGYPRQIVDAADGCELLSFFEGTPQLKQAGNPVYDASQLIVRVQTDQVVWGAATDPNVANTAVDRLLLRPDTGAGDRTWLLRVRLIDGRPYAINGIERHPCVEEMYLLDGDIHMPTGVMQPGAYFWRPPGLAHGPTGTKQGFTALFRAKEGNFSTEWSDSDVPIRWDADYDPVVPDYLRTRI